MAICKFKVGDKVVAKSTARYAYTKDGWTGKVTQVHSNGHFDAKGEGNPHYNQLFTGLCDQYFDLVEEKTDKIVITHDGKTTTATLYRADGSKEKATAKCAPEDKFDFNVGAKLAMERLMNKIEVPAKFEWRVVNRKPRVGDYIRLKTNGGYSFSKPGDVLKIDAFSYAGNAQVLGKNHIRNTGSPEFRWNYTKHEYDVVEKVTPTKEEPKPEPPKPWNGRVVCIESTAIGFTAGKIYKVNNGKLIDDDRRVRPCTSDRIYSPEDLTSNHDYFGTWWYKFVPLVE